METIKELRKICIKQHKKGVTKPHIWATLFARRASIYITWLLVKYTKISANQVTIWQLVVSLIGLGFLCSPDLSAAFVGILFLHLGYIFDNVDGEIARYRKSQSINGMFLDFVNHEIIIPLIFGCLCFHLFFFTGEILYFGLSILLIVGRGNPIGKARQILIYFLIEKRDAPTYNYSNYQTNDKNKDKKENSIHLSRKIITKKEIKASVKTLAKIITEISRYPSNILVVTLLLVVELVIKDVFFSELFTIIMASYYVTSFILALYIHLINRIPERDFIKYINACKEINSKIDRNSTEK